MLAVATVGCTDNGAQRGDQMGELRLGTIAIDVNEDMEPLGVGSKAEGLANSLQLDLVIFDNMSKEVKSFRPYNADVVPTIPLKVGTYRVKVSSSQTLIGAQFDTPQYAAEKNFTIEPTEITTVQLTARETTCSVVIQYDALFRVVFPTTAYRYHAVLTSSVGDRLQVMSDETRGAYFNLPSPNITIEYQIFMDQLIGGVWTPIWGNATNGAGEPTGLKNVSFIVNPDASIGLLPQTRYRAVVKVQN